MLLQKPKKNQTSTQNQYRWKTCYVCRSSI